MNWLEKGIYSFSATMASLWMVSCGLSPREIEALSKKRLQKRNIEPIPSDTDINIVRRPIDEKGVCEYSTVAGGTTYVENVSDCDFTYEPYSLRPVPLRRFRVGIIESQTGIIDLYKICVQYGFEEQARKLGTYPIKSVFDEEKREVVNPMGETIGELPICPPGK